MRAFIEVSIRAPERSEEFVGMLDDREMLGAWESEGILRLYWPEASWSPNSARDLERLLEASFESVAEPSLSVKRIEDQDWNLPWTESLHPIRIGNRVLIRQSWNPVPPSDRIELVIDPRRAFGTGYHATTQMMIELLEDTVRGDESVLDLGTGSGILAMVALRLGARSALGTDTDPVAIDCAADYARVNGFGSELELAHGSLAEAGSGRFDLIAANLDRNSLLPLASRLGDYLIASGVLLISGITREDEDEVLAGFQSWRAKVTARLHRDEWLALTCKKMEAESGQRDS